MTDQEEMHRNSIRRFHTLDSRRLGYENRRSRDKKRARLHQRNPPTNGSNSTICVETRGESLSYRDLWEGFALLNVPTKPLCLYFPRSDETAKALILLWRPVTLP